ALPGAQVQHGRLRRWSAGGVLEREIELNERLLDVIDDLDEQLPRRGADRRRRQRLDQLEQHGLAASCVSGRPGIRRGVERARRAKVEPGRRRQTARLLRELSRCLRRAARGRGDGGACDRRRNALVRPLRRQREMPAPLLRLVGDAGERAMNASAAMLGSVRVDRRAEERMRKADATAYELEDACVDRGRARVLPVVHDGGSDSPSRRDAITKTGSALSRRSANENARADGWSSHCTSSMKSATGPPRASPRSRLRTPIERASRSTSVRARRTAPSNAARCGSGSVVKSPSRTSPNASVSAANASCASAAAGLQPTTCQPRRRASSSAAASSVVFPMPASPSRRRARGRSGLGSKNSLTASSSASRPTTASDADATVTTWTYACGEL